MTLTLSLGIHALRGGRDSGPSAFGDIMLRVLAG